MERTRSETLKLFVISDIGRRSSLLSSIRSIRSWQSSPLRQSGHLRSHALGKQNLVELPEWTGLNRSDGRCALKQILQIVIAVSIQFANRDLLPGFMQLALHRTVVGAAMHFDGKTAVLPERSLGPKTMRCLDQRNQQRRPNRTDRRDLAEQFARLVLLTLGQQIAPDCLAQDSQGIELLVIKFCPAKHSHLGDFREPLRTMTRRIDLLAGAWNTPTAIDRLHSAHHSSEIFADRQIAACQFLQRADACSAVIDRAEFVHVQPVSQLAGIDPVLLVPLSAILLRIAYHQFR